MKKGRVGRRRRRREEEEEEEQQVASASPARPADRRLSQPSVSGEGPAGRAPPAPPRTEEGEGAGAAPPRKEGKVLEPPRKEGGVLEAHSWPGCWPGTSDLRG